MKKIYLIFLLFSCSLAFTQTTTVTATVTFPDGNTFANGTVLATFTPPTGIIDQNLYLINGNTFQYYVGGTFNGSGIFTLNLTDDHKVMPQGGRWMFTVCSVASVPCTNSLQDVFGASIDLSSLISNDVKSVSSTGLNIPILFADTEVKTNTTGGLIYFNYVTQNYRCWDGASWSNCGNNGGSAVNSVFGRLGNVIAISGDYNVSQVTGAAPSNNPTFTGTITLPGSPTVAYTSIVSSTDTIYPITQRLYFGDTSGQGGKLVLEGSNYSGDTGYVGLFAYSTGFTKGGSLQMWGDTHTFMSHVFSNGGSFLSDIGGGHGIAVDGVTGATYTNLFYLLNGTASSSVCIDSNKQLNTTCSTLPPPTFFSSLPTCTSGLINPIREVTDSTTNTWGAIISGSGTNKVLAYCDTTNWTVAAK